MDTKWLLCFRFSMMDTMVSPIGIFDDVETAKNYGENGKELRSYGIKSWVGEWEEINSGYGWKHELVIIGSLDGKEDATGYVSIHKIRYNPT